jgi:hypothetical protein
MAAGTPANNSMGGTAAGSRCELPSEHFKLTTQGVATVPNLLHLFECGWPVGGARQVRVFPALNTVQLTGRNTAAKQQQQLMQVGYRFITVTAREHDISMQQAAAVIELWRRGTAAAITTDGIISAASSSSSSSGGSGGVGDVSGGDGSSSPAAANIPDARVLVVPDILAAVPASGVWSLTALCKAARNHPSVQQLANPAKQAAGRSGASKRKRQQSEQGSAGDD